MKVYATKPAPIPFAIEYDSGMKIMVKNAGIPRPQSVQSIFTAWRIIRKPTTTSAGATASKGTMVTSGEMKIASRNSTPVTMFAKPVRAPAPIPVADSTKIWFAEPDAPPPTTEPKASTSRTLSMSSTLPSFMVPASAARPTETPIASKKTESRIVNTSSEAASGPIWVNAPNRSAEPMREKFGVVNFRSAREGTFRDQPVAAFFTEPEGTTASRIRDSAVEASTPHRIAPFTLRMNRAMVKNRPKRKTRVGQPSR